MAVNAAAGGRCLRGTMGLLVLRRGCLGIAASKLGSASCVSQQFSSTARDSQDGTSRAGDRARAREWEADDQRHSRWKSGQRNQKSKHFMQKKREKTWQNSDPHEDLCRIKWDPDPHVLPKNWFRGHIPDMIKCKMFDLWQEDPKQNSAMALGKKFGLPYLDTQAILTMKLSAKEKVDAGDGYEIYPELEELMVERKEAYIEELSQHYGQDIPFNYAHCPDVDKNDPSTWVERTQFKMAKLTEMDKNDKFDRPPLKTADEVAEDLKYKRTNKAIYAAVRDQAAADLTKELADRPAFPKRRWAYALKDTSTKETTRAPPIMRDAAGIVRGATVSEERGMSFADANLFRRDVRRSSALREIE